VALGAILKLTGVVSEEALLEAILARVPKGTEKLNRAALEAGYNLVG
jgi:2-oxoglutarate ferredoxin oxidoreductase subunit gamma